MKMLKNFAAALIAGAGLLAASQAGALTVTFNAEGDSGSATFTCPACSSGISATVTLTLASFNPITNVAVFNVTIVNNSTLAGDRLVSFGFDNIVPTLTAASANGGWDASLNKNFPGFQQVDLCVWDGRNCSGGGNQGVIGAGGSESFALTLSFTSSIPPITFEKWVAKFQGPNGSFHLEGNGRNGGDLPEPGTLALLGLGLLGLGLRRRRKLI